MRQSEELPALRLQPLRDQAMGSKNACDTLGKRRRRRQACGECANAASVVCIKIGLGHGAEPGVVIAQEQDIHSHRHSLLHASSTRNRRWELRAPVSTTGHKIRQRKRIAFPPPRR